MYSLNSIDSTFCKEEANSADHRNLMKIVSLNPRKHANDQCYIKLYKISNKTIVHMIFGSGAVNLIFSIIYFVLIKEAKKISKASCVTVLTATMLTELSELLTTH